MPDTHDVDHVDPVDPAVARRLAEAFGALATTEVPASAPRPGHAPRPVERDTVSRRRRLGLAGGGLLVAAAAVVLALLLGSEVDSARRTPTAPPGTAVTTPPSVPTSLSTPTTPPTTGTPTTGAPATGTPGTGTSAGTDTPSSAEVAAAFAAATRDTRSGVVLVPGGWEGADLDAGTIRFWRSDDGRTWAVDGTSTYLPDFGAEGTTNRYTASVADAALLSGMDHATFLLDNQAATGDGTGVSIAYTDGPDGWGAITAGSDADLHPSGHGITSLGQDGGMYGGDLRDGELVTVDCSSTAPDNASCGLPAYQVVKSWRWDGDRFVLDHRSGPAS
ncbi:hypothetical protein ACXR2U_12975 [Jatrophihabitans sp. YIM 134969]